MASTCCKLVNNCLNTLTSISATVVPKRVQSKESRLQEQFNSTYLVVALEEVIKVVPLTDCMTGRVQTMTTGLLEIVLPSAHQPAHSLQSCKQP